MNTTTDTTSDRRSGAERRRNMTVAVNPAMHVFEAPAVVDRPRRISWGAVFAGVVLALVTQLTLSLLGLAVGLSSIEGELGLGTAIWMVVTTVIALFIGGAAASRLGGVGRRDGALHGVLTWGIMALVAFFLVTTAVGRIVSFSTDDLTQGLSRIGGGVTRPAPQVTDEMQDVGDLDQRDDFGALGAERRPESMSPDRPARAGLTRVPVGSAAFWAFIGLCVGALAAAAGGFVGAPRLRTRRRNVM